MDPQSTFLRVIHHANERSHEQIFMLPVSTLITGANGRSLAPANTRLP